MNVREQFLDALTVNRKTVYYKVPQQGLLKRDARIKFIIKTLLPKDFLTNEMREEVKKEMSTGQQEKEAIRVVAEKFKKEFMNYKDDNIAKLYIQKGVVYPKIVKDKKEYSEDELPYTLLQKYLDIKLFLINEIAKISPMFQGIK